MLTATEKAARAENRKAMRAEAKEHARIEAEKTQKRIKEITINIEWVKSKTWGSNPHAEARVHYADGTWDTSPVFKCSGCGYDKESTVIAGVFNFYLKYKIWLLADKGVKETDENFPYGIAMPRGDRRYCHFSGGIGTSCYDRISAFIGGEWEHVSGGKTFDVYKYTDKGGLQ